MRKVNALTLRKLKLWEGLRLEAYQDDGGVWTIGYGHTRGVKRGDTCTEIQAERWLRQDVRLAEEAVDGKVKVALTDNQFGALVSFTFNVGVEGFRTSTLLKRLNKGDYESVPAQLMRWNKVTVNGKKVPNRGLTNRRSAEIGLWSDGRQVAGNNVQPASLSPMARSTTIHGAALSTVGTAGAVLTDASQQIALVADYSQTLSIIFVILTLAGIGMTIYGRLRIRSEEGV